MKNAFSMIELVFVIVVIGILAGVAMPKLFANRDTAEIVKFKEEIEAVRKGIEAYAGSQYIETGVKKYPTSLCNATSNCTTSSSLFDFLTNISIPHRNSVSSGRNFIFSGGGSEILIMKNYETRQGYAFSYDSNNGNFTCINKNINGYTALPCKDLGE